MTDRATHSRQHDRKPAPKAVFDGQHPRDEAQFAVPRGCVAWVGGTLRAAPVRDVGSADTATLLYALHNFGYLVPRSGPLTRTLADFAALIELHAARLPVRPVADTLHRLSA